MTKGPTPAPGEVDAKVLRRAFGTFATGVTVVTVGGRSPHGMTANSFTAVSLEPPLALVCIDRTAVMHRKLDIGFFGVSVLAASQERVARHFADLRRPLGAAQFDGIAWRPGRLTGVPLISDALTHLEFELWRACDGGDHTIFIGRLLSLEQFDDPDALLFFRGRFHRLKSDRSEAAT
ncbi:MULTISPECIES: flavin reductase family protein [Thermomonospora]|uniref:Flavin reductase (DIM6/NTAB) family NADH-FMN oxidoreductase RutF n=1 Tax=Thermomonospora cellulosilytica TaxID=1411118 RepID=A0A7W3N579_9ACTN|nr:MULTISPECIES: flavin reductase family protein [Thermomonospora]MBA9007779.1 flavin reductase (DIM6/NTAB) family NADH-FMN oxidoreductase RutF [Thermomonospora cellulosilytica]